MKNKNKERNVPIQRWEDYELRTEKLLKVVLQHLNRTNKVSLLYTTALKQTYLKVALNREATAIQEVLNLAAKAIETCFLFATDRASKTQFVYDEKLITIIKNKKFNPANYTEDIDFVDAIYLAMLSNKVILKELASISMEELPFSPNKTDAFFQDYANFLKSVITKDGHAGDWLTKAFKGTFPDQLQYGIPEYLEHNTVQYLKVWIALLGKDVDAFNEALQTALQKHHYFWSQDEPYISGRLGPNEDEKGSFSLALTAIGKLAHHNGIPVEVKSAYLPAFLISI